MAEEAGAIDDVYVRRSARNSRRQTFSTAMNIRDSTPDKCSDEVKKDRRALLEEWRQGLRNKTNQAPSTDNVSTDAVLQQSSSKKRRTRETIHGDENADPQPMLSRSVPRPHAISSLADRNILSLQGCNINDEEQQHSLNSPTKNARETSDLPPRRSARFTGRDGHGNESTLGCVAAPAPLPRPRAPSALSRRLYASSGSAKKARRKTMSSTELRALASQSASNISTASNVVDSSDVRPGGPNENASSNHLETAKSGVDDSGLKSRLDEMRQRISRLEEEKMQLSLEKAPLEEKLKQKEDQLAREQQRSYDEVEKLRMLLKQSENRIRSLEHENSELGEEKKHMLLELRKSRGNSSSATGANSSFHRSLQNDRENQELRQKIKVQEEEIASLKLEKVSLESEVQAHTMDMDTLVHEFEKLEAENQELEAAKSSNSDAEIKLEALQREHIATAAQLNAVSLDLTTVKSSSKAKIEEITKEWKSEVLQLQFALNVFKARNNQHKESKDDIKTNAGEEDKAILLARIEQRDAKIAELEGQILKGEEIRRQLHNKIQDLRGNIRVFVRTRPFLPSDGSQTDSMVQELQDGETLRLCDKNQKRHQFKFDKVFPPSSGQDSIFNEVSEFVQSALDGYHVVLFCYGMTGSGKTHTMQGSGNGAMRGVIPRAVEQVLAQARVLHLQNWEFTMTASFLEIYNEELRDLLVSMNQTPESRSAPNQLLRREQKLAIKRNSNGKSYVDGLTKIPIETAETDKGLQQLHSLMALAARTRSIACTSMNSQSSRSHSVFMLHLRGYNAETDTVVEGALNLCDLAGSERLDRSGAASNKKTLLETQAINKSLSSLGDVFASLANKSSHVPYRNSKLTHLLQDCLSGDGKALMFVNLSPTVESSGESLCSLRFAQRVNQVELGKATKHVRYGSK